MVSHAKNLRGYIVRIEKVIITGLIYQTVGMYFLVIPQDLYEFADNIQNNYIRILFFVTYTLCYFISHPIIGTYKDGLDLSH